MLFMIVNSRLGMVSRTARPDLPVRRSNPDRHFLARIMPFENEVHSKSDRRTGPAGPAVRSGPLDPVTYYVYDYYMI